MIRYFIISSIFTAAILLTAPRVFAFDVNAIKQELNAMVLTIDSELPETLTEEQKQEVDQDLPHLKEYSSSFLAWAKEMRDGTGNNDGYGAWGLVIDDDFVAQIERAQHEAETAGKAHDYRGAQIALRKWLLYYLALSAHVDIQVKDIDFNSINSTIADFFPEVDAWLNENESLGYAVGSERMRFDALKDKLIDITSSWQGEFPDYSALQSAYYSWGSEYDAWARDAEARFDKQYKAMREDAEESGTADEGSSSSELISPYTSEEIF